MLNGARQTVDRQASPSKFLGLWTSRRAVNRTIIFHHFTQCRGWLILPLSPLQFCLGFFRGHESGNRWTTYQILYAAFGVRGVWVSWVRLGIIITFRLEVIYSPLYNQPPPPYQLCTYITAFGNSQDCQSQCILAPATSCYWYIYQNSVMSYLS